MEYLVSPEWVPLPLYRPDTLRAASSGAWSQGGNRTVSAQVKGQHVNILPDPSFSTNPAKHAFNPDVSSYPKSLKKAFENREKRKSKE
ncbi:hypothetical protein WDD9_006561 [Paenibacillus melissococcoides]|uniref:hypothetical protein n=1 Tax=Paenibacillus melissococcoides TaxID=2912268 RepID=UPI0021C3F227|nr:hypothetical protein [Paenibacillus melissococcoides]CAH8721347.1 hypothetical protein WDD9_006244 [Paenibacillus melissococcoides]CAH8721981.1 hypothetical protein WDD9_006561 [Paenibacillus melissococcoides]